MKNKKIIAFIIAIACVMVLTIALIWHVFEDPTKQYLGGSQASVPEQPENGAENVQEPDFGNVSTDTPDIDSDNEDDSSVQVDPDVPSQSDDLTPSDDQPVSNGKLNPNPTTADEIKAVLNDPFMILVNRERRVSSDYVGADLIMHADPYKLNKTCSEALRQLMNAGREAGYSYTLYSGYRSYSSQYNKYYNKIDFYLNEGKTEEEAIRLTDQYYAPPGASEHHTGLAADVCISEIVNKYACLHEAYEYTEEFEWFSTHAHEYGFILRYPKGDEDITGYNYEPWHYRYVGVEIATEIYNRDITLEEYIEELETRLEDLES